jgi:hypothetical protein
MGSLEVQFQILLAVGAAMFFGALVGLERELADKPAGFERTFPSRRRACWSPSETFWSGISTSS